MWIKGLDLQVAVLVDPSGLGKALPMSKVLWIQLSTPIWILRFR